MGEVGADRVLLPWTSAAGGHRVLVLVRHGRTAWNASRRFLGRTDVGLDEAGYDEVARLGAVAAGRFDVVFSSPLMRAWQTAEALAPPAPVSIPELQELDQGELEGLEGRVAIQRYPEFFASWQRDPERTQVPGGESLGTCRDRGLAALEAIAERLQPGEIGAVVSHQMVIATALCALQGLPLSRWRERTLGNTEVAVLIDRGAGWRVEAFRGTLGAPA